MLKFLLSFLIVSSFAVASLGSEASSNSTQDFSIFFDRILIVVLENQPLKASLKNPLMRDIISKGTLLTNYHALVNPSQPNYIGLLAGDLLGVIGDSTYNLAAENLVDLMEAKNVTWKSYQENYPGNCFAGDTSDGLYKRKHNPFISFDNIRSNPQKCANIVTASELSADLEAGTVPQYSFYTPNMNNNGHDTGLAYSAKWLSQTFLPTYLSPFNNAGNSLLVITFDEGVPGDNKIYTLLIGDMIPEGNVDDTRYNHYSLLQLVESNYGLGSLNRNDATATPITKEFFVKGTFDDRQIVVLSTVLPLVAVIIVGLVAYFLYLHRRRSQQRKQQEVMQAELGGLLVKGADESNNV